MGQVRNDRRRGRREDPRAPRILDLFDVGSQDFIAEDVLHPAFNRILRIIHADSGFITLGSSLGQITKQRYSVGLADSVLASYMQNPEWSEKSLAGLALRRGEIQTAAGTSLNSFLEKQLANRVGGACAAAVPLQIKQQTLGVIVILRNGRRTLSRHEKELMMAVSGQLAVALQNANLFEILHRGKTEWERTFDAIQDLVAILDTGARFVRVNRAFASRLKTQPRHLIGMSYSQSFYGEEEVPDQCPVKKTLQTGVVHSGEVANSKLNSLYRVSTSPLTSLSGEFVGTVVMAQDISDRKRLEQEIRRHRDYLSNILKNSPDAIVATDLEGQIEEFNLSAETLTGYPRDEVIGRNWLEFFASDAHREDLRSDMNRRTVVHNFSSRVSTKSGGQKEISLTLSYLTDELGSPVGTVSIWKDITEWNHLQRQLIQAEKLSALGELVAGVAHELNNPLTSILGYAELLLENPMGDNERRDIQKIHNQGKRMLKIVQNLLRFARSYTPEKGMVDINSVLRNTLDLKSYEMKTDNVTIIENLKADLPSIVGDANQLQQVFLNIINNAHQAFREEHRPREIIVSTSIDEGLARVQITDNGPGIPQENLSKIFDPFFTTKPVGTGTGLGLSVSFGIVEQHGGHISVESTLGEGTTFIIGLPLPEGL